MAKCEENTSLLIKKSKSTKEEWANMKEDVRGGAVVKRAGDGMGVSWVVFGCEVEEEEKNTAKRIKIEIGGAIPKNPPSILPFLESNFFQLFLLHVGRNYQPLYWLVQWQPTRGNIVLIWDR